MSARPSDAKLPWWPWWTPFAVLLVGSGIAAIPFIAAHIGMVFGVGILTGAAYIGVQR